MPRQGRKSCFSLDVQIGCLTLLALSLDAHWFAHASDLLHQGFLMTGALMKAVIVKELNLFCWGGDTVKAKTVRWW